VKNIGNKKVALVGFDITLNNDHLEDDYKLVENLKEENDLVVVNMHWGLEYRKKSNSEQQEVGHRLIEAGADVIIGHHPHVIQEIEIYQGKPIFYSLGNFIFDQSREDTRRGYGVGMVTGSENIEYYIFPYEIKKYQPELLGYDQMKDACSDILGDLEEERCYFGVGR
jgi:poly-gamma-glutamate synthesis protein (capsule biosynthesis protein)